MKKIVIAIICIVLGFIIYSLLTPPAAIGVIGGADGPTAVFVASKAVSSGFDTILFVGAILMVVGIGLIIRLKKR